MVQNLPPAVITRSVVFVVALLVLLVAHQVGDHILQTDHQAAHKTGGGLAATWGMVGHIVTYHAAAVILLLATFALLGLPLTVPGGLAGLGFSAATHALIDRRWPVRRILHATRSDKFAETTTPVNGMYAADQSLHQLALLIAAVLIATL